MTTLNYGVEAGQIYLAADGGKYGHLVVDDKTYIECDDVVVQPFTVDGPYGEPHRIDTFKLAQVRYYLMTDAPDWIIPVLPKIQMLTHNASINP